MAREARCPHREELLLHLKVSTALGAALLSSECERTEGPFRRISIFLGVFSLGQALHCVVKTAKLVPNHAGLPVPHLDEAGLKDP